MSKPHLVCEGDSDTLHSQSKVGNCPMLDDATRAHRERAAFRRREAEVSEVAESARGADPSKVRLDLEPNGRRAARLVVALSSCEDPCDLQTQADGWK